MGGAELQRTFSSFPSGFPGIGLLLLRFVVGGVCILQGGVHAVGGTPNSPCQWIAEGLSVFGGVAVLAGFLTPVAGIIAAAGLVGIYFCSMNSTPVTSFDSGMPTISVLTTALALQFLGPGALSVDARRFGRREIIIPPPT